MHMLFTPPPLSARLPQHGPDATARPGQARATMPRRLALAGVLAALLAPLGACGRKANPEPPPGTPKDAYPKTYPPKGT